MRTHRELKIGKDLTNLKGTHTDFGLILVNQALGMPQSKSEYVDIPFGDGAIDLTEALTGDVKFHNREGSFIFELVDNAFDRVQQLNSFANYIQGRKMMIVRPDEPDYYYLARLNISDPEEAIMVSKVVVNAVADPYRYKKKITEVVVTSTGTAEVTLTNSRMTLIPVIKTTAEVTIVNGDKRITVTTGTHKSLDIKLYEGETKLVIEGNATVTFTYREGDL